MTIFMSKKQRKLMRERRKRKGKTVGECRNEKPSKKRKLPGESLPTSTSSSVKSISDTASSNDDVIVLPADLTAKQAKKFRKDARRKARAAGQDDSKLEFVVQGQVLTKQTRKKEPDQQQRKNKKSQSFPCINDLVAEEKRRKVAAEQDDARKKADSALPDNYKSRYVAVDCEMVGIGSDGKKSVLARTSCVNWQGDVLLDTFVKVPTAVTDFRTHVSGVTAQQLRSEQAVSPEKCRELVASILKDKILVGHALKNDLDALMLVHPKEDIRDTAKYRPFQRLAGTKWRPRKLRDLVKEHLDIDIQVAGESHDSVDDACATMELFKSAREEWEKEINSKRKKKS